MFTVRKESQKERELAIFLLWESEKFPKAAKEVDGTTDGALERAWGKDDFLGKAMQQALFHTQAGKVLVVGLGQKKTLNVQTLGRVIGATTLAAQGKKVTKFELVLPEGLAKAFGAATLGEVVASAILKAGYSFDTHKKKEDDRVKMIEAVTVVSTADALTNKALEKGVSRGKIIGEAVNTTRRLGNTSPSIMTPALLAKEAKALEKVSEKVRVNILERADMKKLGMGCLLGVSQGSELPPKFIIIEYMNGPKSQKPTVLVGKGITFDSGGLSLKPSNYMTDMKFDMLGAATVLGSIKALAALGVKRNIVGLLPSCENMPSGSSYRPDDILTAMNGSSVLIGNTDAEGRLILADALSYAHRYEPKEVIDFATLTGACVVAVGQERSGLFSPDDKMIQGLLKASGAVGEQLWHLPLGEEFTDLMKTPVADIKNSSASRYGGASTAAAFLQHFTLNDEGEAGYPWAHIDLSSSYSDVKGNPWLRGGANGFGVQTMVEYLL